MSEKVSVTLKVDAAVRAGLMVLAKLDRRTMSSYVESWVDREVKEKKIDVTLIEREQQKKSATQGEVDQVTLPDYLNEELWNDWCEHLHENHKINTKKRTWVKYELRSLNKAHQNGWDINALMEYALRKGWKGCVFKEHFETKSDDTHEEIDHREIEYRKLKSYDISSVSTQSVFNQFVEALYQSNAEIEYSVISKAINRMINAFRRDRDRIDAFFANCIHTHSFEVNDEGVFVAMEEVA